MIKKINEKKLRRINEEKENNKKRVSMKIVQYAAADCTNIFEELGSNINGLNNKEVLLKINEQGLNEIKSKDKNTLLKKVANAFINPFTIVLSILALVSFITDYIIAEASDKDLTTAIIILSMVLISGLLRIIQEGKSNKAGENLNNMIKTTCTVRREGHEYETEMQNLVCGDIVKLAAGDMIPADIRIITAKDLFISEASMTGESEHIEKISQKSIKSSNNPLDYENIAFMGTNVISGSAIGIVISTGDNTLLGTMAETLNEKKESTSFDKGVNSVSFVLIRFMAIMVPVVFFVNGLTKGDWMDAFLFGISVAVGLTPEMLPMIVTTNLAKGAVKMAKHKTVVKNLNSIQNFGAMDVLCTDKTGTLTEDKIILERYLDIHGNEDIRVLKHGYLVSAFQTGLKNLLDVAILEHGHKDGLKDLENKYIKIDEIPFDFTRRRMSVVLEDKSKKTQLITKGAVEEMLRICSFAEYKGEVCKLTKEIKDEIVKTAEQLNENGMRVIAVAQKNNISFEDNFSVKDETNMVLMGYIAFLDPPKESTIDAIKALKKNGVEVKVLTGDNDKVTKYVCDEVNINSSEILLGTDIENMSDEELKVQCEKVNIFAKLSPIQKERIVSTLRSNGHVVGFMGDGINDAAAMKKADVGISVDTAVDIAKECADIILLQKDLMVLEEGVIEGRKTFANIIKYIKMTASSNFGNMFSVLIASAFLPFLPMLPAQLLVLNLIYDISCISIPWDNVDEEFLKVPRRWNADSIGSFMKWIGPTSSVFDIVTYIIMFFVICPMVSKGHFGDANVNTKLFIATFNAGWFIESLWSQTLVIHMIRTPKLPFIQSRSSFSVLAFTIMAIVVGTIIPYTNFGKMLGMNSLPLIYFVALGAIIFSYMVLVTIIKKIYIRKKGELL